MSLTFIHTADWQLGKPFASIRDDAKRHRVQRERLDAVRRLQAIVSKTGASFVVVAGDLFDSSQATKATVSSACGAIGALGVLDPLRPRPNGETGAGGRKSESLSILDAVHRFVFYKSKPEISKAIPCSSS